MPKITVINIFVKMDGLMSSCTSLPTTAMLYLPFQFRHLVSAPIQIDLIQGVTAQDKKEFSKSA